MKTAAVGIVGTLLLTAITCSGQTDAAASKAADTFLTGVKLMELPEGKQMLAETIWEDLDRRRYPVFTDASTLFEGMFSTDIPGLQGYKRLIELKALSEAGIPLVKRYILIAYKDNTSGKWKVLEFREAEDLDHEARAAGKRAAGENPGTREFPDLHLTPDQFTYRDYGYWSLLAGKISQAKAAYQKASELNRQNPQDQRTDSLVPGFYKKYTQSYFDFFLHRIGKITGSEQ